MTNSQSKGNRICLVVAVAAVLACAGMAAGATWVVDADACANRRRRVHGKRGSGRGG